MIDRYAREQMKEIWSAENKYRKWLEVEILVCEAWADLGIIPNQAAARIREKATFSMERMAEIEKKVRHDVLAFTTAVGESVGEDARYIHFGLTSSDVLDTALALQLVETCDLLLEDMNTLRDTIKEKARKYRNVPMIGRSHGVHAEPITAGHKFLTWLSAANRSIDRIQEAREKVGVGKISGAVGTYANVNPQVEKYVCKKLGLKSMDVSTQIVPRDIHADFMSALALTAGILDQMATEIRNLQRTEIREMEEPFAHGQKGSSAMPHKKNPVNCEQISGLSRVIRSNLAACLDNIPLWHERDISHSSVERVILPDTSILMDYLLFRLNKVIGDLDVHPENMDKNLNQTGGLIYSQKLLLALVEKGESREHAYDLVQRCALKAQDGSVSFVEMVKKNEDIAAILSPREIETCFDLQYHLKHIDEIMARFGIK